MFLAFFNKKRCYRLKLDDSVARKKAGGRRRTEAFTHTGAFTQRSLYTEELHTHTEGLTQRSLYSKELLHTNA